jgi:protein SCO1
MAQRLLRIVAVFAVALLTVFITVKLTQPPARTVSAPSSVGGAFALIDQNGQTVTDQDMKGKPFLVFFGFTHCPDICPTTLYEISQVYQELGTEADKLGTAFITVDPERDTPDQLNLYMKSFDPRIKALTGDQAAIDQTVKAYKAYAKKVDDGHGGYTMDHTAVIYIMDKDGGFAAPLNLKRPASDVANELRRHL